MAEAIARRWVSEQGEAELGDLFFASAGVAAMDGVPPTAETLVALERLGVDFQGASKHLTGEMIRRADLVLCMTESHVTAARSLVQDDDDDQAKVQRLEPAGDLDDPIGRGQSVYDELADTLLELIPRRLREVLVP